MAQNDVVVEPVPEDLPGIRGYLSRFRQDFDAHNHDGTNSKRFLTLIAETLAARALTIRKRSFTDNTSGMWAGLVDNVMKLYVGTASAYLKWTGTALQIAGDIVAGSLTIGNNASIDSSGNATFISMTSFNMKAYTDFENTGRFITTGDVAATFGNQGMTVAPGAVSTHYSRALWWITNYVFNNNPSFTASFLCLGLNNASGSGQAYIGMGNPTVDGSGHTLGGVDNAGFLLQKASGVTSLYAVCSDGSGGFNQSAALTTLVDNDSVEIFIKLTSSSVKFYYRKNGGSISAATTFTTLLPSAAETYIHFSSTNKATAFDYQIQLQCAAYEH